MDRPYGELEVTDEDRAAARRYAALRKRLNLTQRKFAQLLNVSVGAVRGWEQGSRSPDGASQRLLGIAERDTAVLFRDLGPVWHAGSMPPR